MSDARAAPDWFRRAIGDGLLRLVALGLPGQPQADAIRLTKAAWCDALWQARRWIPDDSGRIGAAFLALAGQAERWPAPRHLLERLPGCGTPAPGTALERRPSAHARANARRHIAEILMELRASSR